MAGGPSEAGSVQHLVVYGTLRSGTGWRERLGVDHLVRSEGACLLRGALYDLGWYPGFVPGDHGDVTAEVLALLDDDALAVFDRFEGIGVDGSGAVEYRRDAVDVVVEPGPSGGAGLRAAWLYVFTGAVRAEQRVSGGDWLTHLATAPPATEARPDS